MEAAMNILATAVISALTAVVRAVPAETAAPEMGGWGHMAGNQLPSINHVVQLMLENRSFDHMLGFLYPKSDNFEGLTGSESNTDASGNTATVHQIDHTAAGAHFMPGGQDTRQRSGRLTASECARGPGLTTVLLLLQ